MEVVSVPLPGFSGLRHLAKSTTVPPNICFSPVAGIQWVETAAQGFGKVGQLRVSVPLPGFSGLRLCRVGHLSLKGDVSVPLPGFSGLRPATGFWGWADGGFSPVAGIQWVETRQNQKRSLPPGVSVPLPGFSGLRP